MTHVKRRCDGFCKASPILGIKALSPFEKGRLATENIYIAPLLVLPEAYLNELERI